MKSMISHMLIDFTSMIGALDGTVPMLHADCKEFKVTVLMLNLRYADVTCVGLPISPVL